MRLQLLVRKRHRLENDIAGFLKEDNPRHRRQHSSFSFFDSRFIQKGKLKNIAGHRRAKSNEVSQTIDTEESQSGEEMSEISHDGMTYGSNELLSPFHMIQYGKALSETFDHNRRSTPETVAYGNASSKTSDQNRKSISEAEEKDSLCLSDEEDLSYIMEETESQLSIGMPSRASKSRQLSPDEPRSTFEHSNPMDYLSQKTIGKNTVDTNKFSSHMNTITPRMIQMDGSFISPSKGSWADFGNDSSSRRDFILKQSKRPPVSPFGIKRLHKCHKGNEYISFDEFNSHHDPIINCRTPPSSNTSEPSSNMQIQSKNGSLDANRVIEEESSITSTCGESSDQKELLLGGKQSTKKTHRRSSSRWRDLLFSQAIPSPSSCPTEMSNPISLSDALDSEPDTGGQMLEIDEDTKIWKLVDGTMRVEL